MDIEFPVYDFNPNHVPDRALRAIGLMAMASAQTEAIMGEFIGAILQIDNIEVFALTTHLSTPQKDQIARALIELNSPIVSLVDEVDDLLDEIGEALKTRNVVIHNPLCIHPPTGDLFSYRGSARGKVKLEIESVSVEKIEKDAERLISAGLALMDLMSEFVLKPLDRTRPVHKALDRKKSARSKRKDKTA